MAKRRTFEMKDLELHSLVRNSLQDLKPEYQPAHWNQMQAKLILAPIKFPWKIWTVAVPTAIGAAFWWYGSQSDVITPQDTTSDIAVVKNVSKANLSGGLEPKSVEKLSFPPAKPEERSSKTPQEETVQTSQDQLLEPSEIPQPMVTHAFNNLNSGIGLTNLKTYFIEQKIRNMVLKGTIVGDSTTFKVLERNKDTWQQAAVVCDWTSSMFPYGTQIFTWLDQNQENQSLIGYLFFNDCDADGKPLDRRRAMGGMYHTEEKDPQKVLDVMIEAVRTGVENVDLKENDLEALVASAKLYPHAEELVLIADNVSPVRHPQLISKIHKPVRIIVCGSTLNEEAIQPIYLELAQATGGSIHTIEDDLLDVANIPNGKWIKVGDKYYRYNLKKGRFVETSRKKRPKL